MVNPSAFETYREVMGDEWSTFITGLIDTFEESVPKQVEQMKDALATEDLETLKRMAHTLKSSATTIGAESMRSLCVEVESLLKSGDLEGSEVLITQLDSVLPKIFQDLERIRPKA